MIKGVKLDGFSNYWIFPTLGMVWSIKSNRWIGNKNPKGYWYVTLYDDNGKPHTFRLHRLIWEVVHGEIPENMQINHISEDKNDNSIFNLNLMTPKENTNWGTGVQRSAEKRSKQVGAYQDGVLVLVFPSTQEAGRQGYQIGNVSKCCNGTRQSHRGYQWRYVS